MELNKQERKALCKLVIRYVNNSSHDLSTREGYYDIIRRYEQLGPALNLKDHKAFLDLVNEALASEI